jgi:hypothetical protein
MSVQDVDKALKLGFENMHGVRLLGFKQLGVRGLVDSHNRYYSRYSAFFRL